MNKPNKKAEILSFRTTADIKKKVDKTAKRAKLSRAEFIEQVVAQAVAVGEVVKVN